MLSHSQIKHILPHRYPMLLVDAVHTVEPGVHITAIKNITGNEACFAHLVDTIPPAGYAYPQTLIIESFCQAAGIMYALQQQEEADLNAALMLFGSIAKFRFYDDAFPGDTLEHRARLERAITDAAIFSGEVWVKERKIADVERVVVALRPAETLVATSSNGAHATG